MNWRTLLRLKPWDLPPLWTIATVLAAWILEIFAPTPWPSWLAPPGLGAALICAAVALTLWAAFTMIRADTDVAPRQQPTALVTGGPFRFSRNPIYLADVAIVAACAPIFGSIWPLAAAVLLGALLDRAFIRSEEAALRAAFPESYADYAARVRRWL